MFSSSSLSTGKVLFRHVCPRLSIAETISLVKPLNLVASVGLKLRPKLHLLSHILIALDEQSDESQSDHRASDFVSVAVLVLLIIELGK